VYELAFIALRWNPFLGATVPELPTLTATTNAPAGGTHSTNLMATATQKGTNAPSHPPSTNAPLVVETSGTNSASHPLTPGTENNSIVRTEASTAGTNSAAITSTNGLTNTITKLETKSGSTNAVSTMASTNIGTNLALAASTSDTNAAAQKPKKKKPGGASMPEMAGMPGMPGMPGMGFNPFGPPGKHGVDLPPALQARVNRITESEVLGAVMHPLPMALLGIAGEYAFLSSDSGQTGLVKEGDTLADLKLLRIGINRVLVEQSGQKKELMIFDGYGGESLLPKDSSNENTHP
jgi:hypothetical protein